MDISHYFQYMVEKKASDLFLSAGAPVNIKIEGMTETIGMTPLGADTVKTLAYSVMNDAQIKVFESTMEMNLAISVKQLGRFRINIYRQRGGVAMVVRHILSSIPSLEQLNLPVSLKELIMAPSGLVLVVGATGAGKSATLASLIDYRNEHSTGHILLIEDPIEYIHHHKKSIVDQREVGLDTLSYSEALMNAMRESPDVIMIGEIRDRDTMQNAISYAETGHLCLSTLHARNANQALERITNFFPELLHEQVLMDLSLYLKAIVSQRLIIGIDGKRLPAVEIMLNSPYITDLIQHGRFNDIKDVMEKSAALGMQTMDTALLGLYQSGRIDKQAALANADSQNNLALKIRLSQGGITDISPDLSIQE